MIHMPSNSHLVPTWEVCDASPYGLPLEDGRGLALAPLSLTGDIFIPRAADSFISSKCASPFDGALCSPRGGGGEATAAPPIASSSSPLIMDSGAAVEATVVAMRGAVERYEARTREGGWEDAFRRREDIGLILTGDYLRAIAVRGHFGHSLP